VSRASRGEAGGRLCCAAARRPLAEKYAADQAAFFADYAIAHQKLSELGVAWEEGAPITL
jgi:hypothetical protein